MAKKNQITPEVICLSDDDDDNSDVPTPIATPVKEKSVKICNGDKKPESIIQRKDIVRIPDLTIKRSDLVKKPIEIQCSLISFGIVNFQVETGIVSMKETEFEFKLKGDPMENLNIRLAYSDINTFSYSFQSQPAAAFIEVRKEFAELFETYIPSKDPQGKRFDPNSSDEKRRRIVLTLDPLTPEMEAVKISAIYYYLKSKSATMNVRCVTGSRAQELYNLSRLGTATVSNSLAPPFVIGPDDLKPRTVGLNHNAIRFDLSSDDFKCLNEGEFLNDNIIDFYLQYIYYEKLSEEDRQRTYLFNSFFYTRLTRKGNEDISNISAAERRYNRVKRWLRDVDIFSKDFLIVPINQTAHWFIVLIQYHNEVLTEADLISDDEDAEDQSTSKKKKIQGGEPSSTIASEPMEMTSKTRSSTPAIVMFDSLRAGSKNRVAATLREFLQLEYDHKKTLPIGSKERKIFNIETINAIEAAVPQQPNYFDCGLYILQYMESFFAHRSPTINFQSLTTFENWCESNTMGSSKRKQIFDIINEHIIVKDEEENHSHPV